MCLVSRDKIPQLCVSRNPNENVASVKRESRFRVSEDPLTRSISIQPLSSTIVSLRKDRRAEICPTPGRSTNRIRSECPHPSIVISSTARIIRSVRLNKTIVRARTARNSSIPISYLPLLRSVQQKRFSTTAVFYTRDRNRSRISRMYEVYTIACRRSSKSNPHYQRLNTTRDFAPLIYQLVVPLLSNRFFYSCPSFFVNIRRP